MSMVLEYHVKRTRKKKTHTHVYAGLSIVNGAPAMKEPDEEILKLCDIFCINETEVHNKETFDTSRRDDGHCCLPLTPFPDDEIFP